MSIIAIPYIFSPGATIVSSQVNSCNSVIYNDYNGNISNSNLSSSLVISDTKLAQITDASKVSATAITNAASLPSGAGIWPLANLPSLLSTSNLLNYGTSQSASSTVAPASLKMAYGYVAQVSNSASTTQITNLSFTSSTSYIVIAQVLGVSSGVTVAVQSTSMTSSSFYLFASTNNTPCYWVAIGT